MYQNAAQAMRPTRAPAGWGLQGDIRAAAGRQGAAAGRRYARARPRRRRRELLREIFSPRLLLPSILLFAEATIRENLVTRNLELNLEDNRRAENQICFQKAYFLS